MNYHKRYTNENDYVIEEIGNDGRTRKIDEQQPDYLAWLAAGNTPESIPYEPPPPPPEPTLEEAQAQKREDLKWTRDEIIGAGFLFGEHRFPLSADVQLTMLTEFVGSQVIPAPSYSWKDMGGVYRQIGDVAAFQSFCMAVTAYGKSLYAREEMLQTLVNAAGSVDEVNAVTWETVPEEAA